MIEFNIMSISVMVGAFKLISRPTIGVIIRTWTIKHSKKYLENNFKNKIFLKLQQQNLQEWNGEAGKKQFDYLNNFVKNDSCKKTSI